VKQAFLLPINLSGPLPLMRRCVRTLLFLTGLVSSSVLILLAKPSNRAAVTGRLQSSSSSSQAATNAPLSGVAIPPSLFGLHIVNGNYPTVPFSLLRTTGVSWTHLEPARGTFDWSALDAEVNLALANNLTMMYTTNKVPSWAASDTKTCAASYPGSPYISCTSGVANLADWDGFISALVQRYQGKIAVYELWNEPDQDFTGPMSDFVPLAQHYHDIVRANDPAAMVAAPAVVTVSWLDTFWAAGGVTDVDSVDFHGYLSSSAPAPENLASQKLAPLSAITAKYGLSAKPVWDSEGSWGDPNNLTDLQAQAAFVARYYLMHWSNGVSRFYWYSWDDNGSGPGGVGWGSLFNPTTKQALPAATAYAQIYSWMVGSTMTQPCAVANSIWTCGFSTSSGGTALAVWNPSATTSYAVS
jgi:hypothetical protein